MMADFLTYQIEFGNLKYAVAIAKYPQYKDAVDARLKEMGWKIDENGNCVGD